jgi:hypothetical protein
VWAGSDRPAAIQDSSSPPILYVRRESPSLPIGRHDDPTPVQKYAQVDAIVTMENVSAIMAKGEPQVLTTLSSLPHTKSEEEE